MPISALALSETTHLKISGPDVRKFLQGQFTCDINDVSANQTRLAAHCSPQGRMLALGRLYQYGDGIYFSLPTSIATTCMQNLKPYAMFSKTSLTEAPLHSIGIMGDEARTALSTLINLPELPDTCVVHESLLIIKVRGNPERYEIIGPAESLSRFTNSLGLKIESNAALWWQADIEAGQAFLCPETLGKFLPHDIQLPENNGVSYTKGCYIGQEIIARMHYLGKLKKQLWLISLLSKDLPQAGLKILDTDNKAQAELICVAATENESYLGLAIFNQAPQANAYLLENHSGSISLIHAIG
ncbi:MAG: hypothetical protein Q7V63_07655 [Gammaproteobacteria bacterium]|nr:hypothetical protein [Gammaproteobacteria bacterium]